MKKLIFLLLFYPCVVNGATIIRFVNTDSSAGGNGTTNDITGANRAYASFNEFEAAENTDLTDAGGDIMKVLCEGTTNIDTTATTIAGWTTAPASYLWVLTDVSVRHSGIYSVGSSTSSYALQGTDEGTMLNQFESYVRFEGLQIGAVRSTAGSAAAISNNSIATGGAEVWMSHCIISGGANGNNSGSGYAITTFAGGATATFKVWNNIIFGFDRSGFINGGFSFNEVDATGYYYSNTIIRNWRGINHSNGSLTLKNNIAQNQFSASYVGTFESSSTHNIGEQNNGNTAFGDTWTTGTTDGTTSGHLIDSGKDFPTIGVQVGSVVKNTTDTTYSFVTVVANGDLTINNNIFVSGENYEVYTNLFGAVTFEDETGKDFHLDAGDTLAASQGSDLDGDVQINVTDDIDGDARDADTPNVGADEFASAPPTPSGDIFRGQVILMGKLNLSDWTLKRVR